MRIKKPSEFFENKTTSNRTSKNINNNIRSTSGEVDRNLVVSKSVVESFEKFRSNFDRLDELNETVNKFSEELSGKVNRSEFENATLTHLMIIDENFKSFKNQIEGINQKDLSEIYNNISEFEYKYHSFLNELENKFDTCKRNITGTEFKVEEMVTNFKSDVDGSFLEIKEEIESKLVPLKDSIVKFSELLDETFDRTVETSKQQKNLSKVVDKKLSENNKVVEKYSSIVEDIQSEIDQFKKSVQEDSREFNSLIEEKIFLINENLNENLDQKIKELVHSNNSLSKEVTNIKTDLVINEKHIKKVEKYIQENHEEIATLREEIFSEIEKIPVGDIQENIDRLNNKIEFIRESYSKINTENFVKEVLNEGITNEPPNVKNSDPLTPLDQKFVTLNQLQEHYRLFVNRIQQQISTLGGGGEARLKYLDDIVGIATNASDYDGKFLKYDHSLGKFVFETVSGGGGGGSQTLDQTLKLGNTSSLGMSVGVITATSFIGNLSGNSSSSNYATSSGISTYSSSSGISTYATSAGIATYAGTAGIATYAGTAGIATNATYATNAGIATYAGTAGIATYATTAGIVTYATTAGVSTYATTAGIATYATTAGVSTSLQNARTFEITGDIVASAVSFDGTGNVSLSATIQPNSVSLGSQTTGDYIQSISGTSNQITVTNGTGESSTPTLSIPNQFTVPQDATVTRDLQVNRNLNVNGNITIGGTSATLFTTELKISDPDIVLGFRTDSFGNDISTDNTANHGGVALASTEGTPLVQLFIAGIETNPATYKKFMWFKSGTFSGLGTDAWISNYAIGIGSTQFPSGTRLAAGSVQFTEQDLSVVRNINSSGIVTGSSFRPSSGYIQAADGTNSFYIYSGTGDVAFQGKINTVQINSSQGYKALDFGSTTTPSVNITNSLNVGSGVSVVGIVTASSFSGNATSATYATTAGVSTSVIGGISSVTQLQVTGISTFLNGPIFVGSATTTGTLSQLLQVTGGAYVSGNLGVGTTNPGTSLDVSGKIQIQQDINSNNRLIFRGTSGSTYRWNIDNYQSSNTFRIFREDDATSANGYVALSITPTGTVTATKFVGDGSELTGIVASGSGVVIQNQGSTVGTAATINFSTNLTATLSSGVATITATGGSGTNLGLVLASTYNMLTP